MAVKKPLVLGSNGLVQQLQTGDTIVVPSTANNTQAMSNAESGPIVIGTPVYNQAAGAVKKAQANAAGTSRVMGLVGDASVAAAASGSIVTDGILSATTTQWDAVTGETGGLTFGAIYFLDPANSGKLTRTPPSTVGQLIVKVGIALSATDMDVTIEPEILL